MAVIKRIEATKKPENLMYQGFRAFPICIKLHVYSSHGVPGGIRTPDNSLRRRVLYPTELLRRMSNNIADKFRIDNTSDQKK